MKTKSSPSRYRYCISRLSTLATSTRTPALNVLSTTLPDSTFFSLVRTKAPPLPGLTCWKSTTLQSAPSMLSVMPFLRSLVVATSVCLLHASGTRCESEHQQFLGGRGEYFRWSRCARPGCAGLAGSCRPAGAFADDEGVLDPDTALAGQVDPRLDRDGDPFCKSTCTARSHQRRFVHLETDTMSQSMTEMPGITGCSYDVSGSRVDQGDVRAGHGGFNPGQLRGCDKLIDLPLPCGRLAQCDCPGHVGVVAVEAGTAVDRDQVAAGERPCARRVVRDRAIWPAGHDGVEGHAFRTKVDHGPLQHDGEASLRPAGLDLGKHRSKGLVCDRAGSRQQLDLALVLDRPELLDDVAEWHE